MTARLQDANCCWKFQGSCQEVAGKFSKCFSGSTQWQYSMAVLFQQQFFSGSGPCVLCTLNHVSCAHPPSRALDRC
jgi:hypothetical protein